MICGKTEDRERDTFLAAVRQAETKKSDRLTGYSTSDHAERFRSDFTVNETPRGLFIPSANEKFCPLDTCALPTQKR